MEQPVALVAYQFGNVGGQETARWLSNLHRVDEQPKTFGAALTLVVKSPSKSEEKACEGDDNFDAS